MRIQPGFYTRRGLLTKYGLSCGYIETKTRNFIRIELYREHETYHLRAFDESADAAQFRLSWDTFPTLGAARAHYRKLKMQFH